MEQPVSQASTGPSSPPHISAYESSLSAMAAEVDVLYRIKRTLEPAYLYCTKHLQPIEGIPLVANPSNPPLSLQTLLDFSCRLNATTRAPPDYLPSTVILPANSDRETLLATAANQDICSPVLLSGLHPLYHPPFPLTEEIQMSQLFKLHSSSLKKLSRKGRSRALTDRPGRWGKEGNVHWAPPHPPLLVEKEKNDMSEKEVKEGAKLLRRPDFLPDCLSRKAVKPLPVVRKERGKVWIKEETRHGKKKFRLMWEQQEDANLDEEDEGVLLTPPKFELRDVDGDVYEICLSTNHGGGGVIVYSLYDSSHTLCCGCEEESSDMWLDEDGALEEERLQQKQTQLSASGWFLYDDTQRPTVSLKSSQIITLWAYLHIPYWCDSPYLQKVIQSPSGPVSGPKNVKETPRTDSTTGEKARETSWTYSLFMKKREESDSESDDSSDEE